MTRASNSDSLPDMEKKTNPKPKSDFDYAVEISTDFDAFLLGQRWRIKHELVRLAGVDDAHADELRSAGLMALWAVWQKYSGKQRRVPGKLLHTFIRRKMIDSFRTVNREVTRGHIRERTRFEKERRTLQAETGVEPTDEQVFASLGWGSRRLQSFRQMRDTRRVDPELATLRLIVDETPEAPERLQVQERDAAIRKAVDALPGAVRRAIALHFYDGLTFREIASIEGVTFQAIQLRARKGLRLLTQKLHGLRVREGLLECSA